ncbi:hypothetical protein [Mucilaginibacter paludis]|uniref:Sigma-70 family RNA polymerase sigma factor n=1 Tax=Mucilaginibacter paludis DSM 18603 TaxID=714943 RepID=H1YD64_9SPHI|nr:hypothetical protein [Mucilaginibacter paludis]EHQ26121.1 sigma-70 family RNA polymerase sigma factor [Mucilaginibacter paludis DSM 18603]
MIQTLLSNEKVLKLIRAKSRAGAEALYDQYAVVLRFAIFRIAGETDNTDIILEKAICKIWDSADLYNEHELPLLAWMLGIAKGLAKEYCIVPL